MVIREKAAGMRRLIGVGYLLLVGLPSPAVAGHPVYRWQDGEGVAQFGDRPGAPVAETVRPGRWMSVVDTAPARALGDRNPMRPYIEREIRWQQEGRREQRQAAERETAAKERRCSHLQAQIRAAERIGHHARERVLEEQYYGACR